MHQTLSTFGRFVPVSIFISASNIGFFIIFLKINFFQSRSIQELAKKDFENLRQNGNDWQPQPKKRGRPPGKSLKKSIERSPVECVGPESLSDTTLASGGEKANCFNTYNLRKGSSACKLRPADASNGVSHGSLNGETCTSWLSEWENEFPGLGFELVEFYDFISVISVLPFSMLFVHPRIQVILIILSLLDVQLQY